MSIKNKILKACSSVRNVASFIGISFVGCCGLSAIPGFDFAVPLFFILTAAALGGRLVARNLLGPDTEISTDHAKTVKKGKITEFESARDPIAWLKNCDIRRQFPNEISILEQTYSRIAAREAYLRAQDQDSPFVKAFDLVKTQVLSDIKSSGQFMAAYHPSSLGTDAADKSFLYGLIKDARAQADKLDKLVEQAIATESVADDVDTTYVDDLLESLKELQTRQI